MSDPEDEIGDGARWLDTYIRGASSEVAILAIEAALRRARTEGAQWMLDSVRGALAAYPDGGGDIEVMKHVERIRKQGEREGLLKTIGMLATWAENVRTLGNHRAAGIAMRIHDELRKMAEEVE